MKSFAILVVVLCCAFSLAKEDQMNPAKSKLKRQRHIEKRTEQTICEIRRAEAQKLPGAYVPQCEADGSFKPMQCSGSTGYCWCVDRYGCEISGTPVPPGEIEPVCVKDQSKCEKQRAKGGGIGAYVPQCEADGSYSPTQCSGSTGYCWCVDFNGDEIPDTKVPPGANKPLCTECEKQRGEGENQEKQEQIGTFVPQCDAVGYFTPLQCSGSTGYCWCVDGNGNEIPGTRTPPGSPQPVCRAKTECEIRRREAENQQSQGMVGIYVPQCEADGSFNPMQCSGSTGSCWCVNQYGCEIAGTEASPGNNKPNCSG